MKTNPFSNLRNCPKVTFSTAMPILAISVVFMLANGWASTTARKLTEEELGMLKKTQTVLIIAEGVKGTQQDFFVGPFKQQLILNAATPSIKGEKGESSSEYDVVITLKCHYFDYGHYSLRRPDALQPRIGGEKTLWALGSVLGAV